MEINRLIDSDYEVMVPGHGEVGGKEELKLQLQYFEMLDKKVTEIVYTGGTIVDALEIKLEDPFIPWRRNGLYRLEMNTRFMYNRIAHKKKVEEEKAKNR